MNAYNFTDRVRKVLQMAREEAARLHHEYVGTEHLLLGLIREGEGVATAVLTNLNVDLEEIQQKIEETVEKGKAAASAGPDLPYTSRAKKVLEFAMSEARELRHSYVGTEHLLLGLLREEKGIAAQVLIDAGVSIEMAREETLRLLGSEEQLDGEGRAAPFPYVSHGDIAYLFGPRIRVTLGLARHAAWSLQQHAIDTEHLLLALVGEAGEAAAALQTLEVPVDRIAKRFTANRELASGVPSREMPYTLHARQAIWLAAHEAFEAGHETVGSGHLLLGLLRVPGAASDLLAELGVTLDRARTAVARHRV